MKQSYCRLFYMLATMAAASSLCAQQSEKPEFRYIANPPPPATGPHTGTLDVFIQKLKPQGELPLSFLKAEHGDLAAWKAEARTKVLELLHYAPEKVEPKAEVVKGSVLNGP